MHGVILRLALCNRARGEMAGVEGAETEAQRLERVQKEHEEAEAAAREPVLPPPPGFVQFMQFMEENRRKDQESQNRLMQELVNRVAGGRDPGNGGVRLSEFQDTRPVPFASAVEPMDAEDWLQDTERKLRTVGCNDEEKIRYATHLLSGPAASWWENLVAIQPPGRVFTWEEFKKKFREHHVPESIVELKRREFETLKQDNSPVLHYIRQFTMLSRYAMDEVDTEEKRKRRFLKGLHPYVKMQLRLTRVQEFQELIDTAITFEDDYKQVQEERRKRAKMEPKKFPVNRPAPPNRNFQPRFRPSNNPPNRGNPNPKSNIICGNCGVRGHVRSECQRPRIVCYGCGKDGHIKPDCPNTPPGGWPRNGGNKVGGRSAPVGRETTMDGREESHSEG